ncbi:MAG: hypothetical protein ACI3Y0_07300 [Prevotella sp.]
MKEDLWNTFKIAVLAAIVLLFASCKTTERVEYVPVETVKTEYRDRLVETFDSIHVRDSVFFAVKGDTVYKYKQQLIYKNKFVHDTVYVGIRDSIPAPYSVEKDLSRWDRFKVDYSGWVIFTLLLLLLCIILLYRFRKS